MSSVTVGRDSIGMDVAGATGTLEASWQDEVRRLAASQDAVILAHNYQTPDIQDVAHHVGDSLALSRIAANTDASTIVFCGVHFMAETAKLLSPDKRVLVPTAEAGCSLADTIDADALRAWKSENPGAAVVAYVNTSAAVKAEADICCTSSNAVEVVESIPADTPVLFLPDQFLGAHVQRATGRTNIKVWMGECHVHAGISPTDIRTQVAAHPTAEVLVHPECGCASSAIWLAGEGDLPIGRTRIMSTGAMVDAAREMTASTALVATEIGMLHQLRKVNDRTTFLPMNAKASCRYMKMTNAQLLLRCLREGRDEITIPADIAAPARRAVERMIAIGKPGGGE
ncbi:quinolinate synthase NadA [Jatrophihabitans sp. DSM 44399]|jgi:quinolinate synthase|uniref:Quinolinate synthase n=2 Tax=Jatrophihabitans lederbergiae TaxID=3075547 RepID=A0ABU2JE77_9ACTN|nr:quinolinate synthase NadA [Jatrophihabitans sp. DSM 44399]MDT0262774.1 quinolinate synthase NadA [Jatrophihabitans sp. DSM 44399]